MTHYHKSRTWTLYDNCHNPVALVCEECEVTVMHSNRHRDIRGISLYNRGKTEVRTRKPWRPILGDKIETPRVWLANAYGIKSAKFVGNHIYSLVFKINEKTHKIDFCHLTQTYYLTSGNNTNIITSKDTGEFMISLGYYMARNYEPI